MFSLCVIPGHIVSLQEFTMVKVLVLLDIPVTVAQSVQKFVRILMEVNVLRIL